METLHHIRHPPARPQPKVTQLVTREHMLPAIHLLLTQWTMIHHALLTEQHNRNRTNYMPVIINQGWSSSGAVLPRTVVNLFLVLLLLCRDPQQIPQEVTPNTSQNSANDQTNNPVPESFFAWSPLSRRGPGARPAHVVRSQTDPPRNSYPAWWSPSKYPAPRHTAF